MEIPPAGSPPLQHFQHSCHKVTSALTPAGIPARSFGEQNTTYSPAFTHLEAITDDNTLCELRRLGLAAIALLLDTVHIDA